MFNFKVAIANIPKQIFAVFSVQFGNDLMVEPDQINDFMTIGGTVKLPDWIHILPWQTEEFSFWFLDDEKMQEPVQRINIQI